ncbi:TIGR02452 family protein [Dactylosporangium sp. NPDC051484]|uniref:TIGR02452 family protein n=1 Tax=Dactylosporangium sp. NPDC051484 TaxID=3154942 RepID=UPI00344C1033
MSGRLREIARQTVAIAECGEYADAAGGLAAAPNLGAILRNQPADAGEVPAVLRVRAARVLRVAAAHGHRTLVLGAWGCGVFRNVPAEVAQAFAGALREVPCFDRVVFDIYDRLPGTPVH